MFTQSKALQSLLKTISQQYHEILGDNLVGIYIHGSIAFACFTWHNSDIDFLVVVNEELSKQTKLDLLAVLEKLRIQAPPKGFEMSIVLEKYCVDFEYPTPYELHFSNYWLTFYLKSPDCLCTDSFKTDKDLAAHFTVIKHCGIVLWGDSIGNVFGEVSKEYYLDSILYDMEDVEKQITVKPVYFILTLCRVLAFLQDGMILSKQQAAQWGQIHLPEKYNGLIMQAAANNITQTQMTVSSALVAEFCNDMQTRLKQFD